MPTPPTFANDQVAKTLSVITPDDGADLADFGLVYVGTGGNLVVVAAGDPDGTNITLSNVPSGTLLPILIKRVRATSTTATNLVLVR
jgi:hypothetical protein